MCQAVTNPMSRTWRSIRVAWGTCTTRRACNVGLGVNSPLSPLNYGPMEKAWVKILAWALPSVCTPAGLLHDVAWADDTISPPGSWVDAVEIAAVVVLAEDTVALGSKVANMHFLCTRMEGHRVRREVPSMWIKGVWVLVPATIEYVRSLGCHRLPHVFHKKGLHKLMSVGYKSMAVVSLKSLRDWYLLATYNLKAGGMARCEPAPPPPPTAGVSLAPGTPPAMWTLRVVACSGNMPAHRLLGPADTGRSGISPLGPDMLAMFVDNHAHQLNHTNPLT